jgi:hypothetical protein
VYAYRMPEESFEAWDRFWVSRATLEPLELVELGDVPARHADSRIELRMLGLWESVIGSTLDFSGIRLRNATLVQ